MPVEIAGPGEALFTAQNLALWLGLSEDAIDDDRAAVVEAVVWGWLAPVLGLDERPNPTPPQVFSWALELGAIAFENPAGYSEKELGPARKAFSAERRDQILEAAGSDTPGSSAQPQGSFPDPSCYPDPALPGGPFYPDGRVPVFWGGW